MPVACFLFVLYGRLRRSWGRRRPGCGGNGAMCWLFMGIFASVG